MATKGRQGRRPRSAPISVNGCRHHWLIEPPNGPTARGVCKLCGTEAEFRTSSDGYVREDKTSSPVAWR